MTDRQNAAQCHSGTGRERKDVIIVASAFPVSIPGSPEEYRSMMVSIRVGMESPEIN